MRQEGAFQVGPAAVTPAQPWLAPGPAARPRNSHQTGGAGRQSPAADEWGGATFCVLSSYTREEIKRRLELDPLLYCGPL
jgi:hypothetical protein